VYCNGTVGEMGALSKLSLKYAFGGLQTLDWLTICEGVLIVLTGQFWCLFHYQIVVLGPDDVRDVPCVMTPNDGRRGMFYRI